MRPNVCPQCQDNKHTMCVNPGACICAMRGHPDFADTAIQAATPQGWVPVIPQRETDE